MRKIKYLIVLSIILILYCCDNPTEPSKIKRILPLNEGNIWVYQEYNKNGNDGFVKNGIDTIRVLKDTTVNDFKFYYVKFLGIVLDFGYINDSLYCFVDPNYTYLKPTQIYSYPCKTGDAYSAEFGLCEVENIDTLISVQAGKFKCIKYKFSARIETGEGFNNYHYCSPGVGLIKIERFENSYSSLNVFVKKSELELINFKIKD